MGNKKKNSEENIVFMEARHDDLPEAAFKQDGSTKNIHAGHRERLRNRYMADGIGGFSDHELLELLLGFTIPRADTNPIAHRLIDEFSSLKGVFEARPEQLKKVRGMGAGSAVFIAMIRDCFRRYEQCSALETKQLANRKAAQEYCLSLSAGERNEQFRVICLDTRCKLLGTRKITDGTLNEVAAYPRVVVETALNYNAHSVILTHNHPGGTLAPSREDIASTLQLQRLLGGLGVILLDHIIVAGLNTYSMVEHGDMDFRSKMREDIDLWPDISPEEEKY